MRQTQIVIFLMQRHVLIQWKKRYVWFKIELKWFIVCIFWGESVFVNWTLPSLKPRSTNNHIPWRTRSFNCLRFTGKKFAYIHCDCFNLRYNKNRLYTHAGSVSTLNLFFFFNVNKSLPECLFITLTDQSNVWKRISRDGSYGSNLA